eukprot:scaffold519437_cov42-Prasinocladus_malaysianus.AAC.1
MLLPLQRPQLLAPEFLKSSAQAAELGLKQEAKRVWMAGGRVRPHGRAFSAVRSSAILPVGAWRGCAALS